MTGRPTGGGCARRWTGPAGWSSGCGRRWWSRRSRPRRRGGSSIPTSTWTTTCAGSRCPPPARCASCWTWPRSRCSRRWTPRAPCGRRCTSRAWEGGNRAALLIKLSHAITDGLGALALFEQIYDTEREPEPRPMPPVPVPRDLSGEDLLRDSLRHCAGHDALDRPELAGPGGGYRRPPGHAAGTDGGRGPRLRRLDAARARPAAGRAVAAAAPPEPGDPDPRARAAARRPARGGQGGRRVGQRRLPRRAVRRPGPVPRGPRRAGRGRADGHPGQPAHRRRPGVGQPVRGRHHSRADRRIRSGRSG